MIPALFVPGTFIVVANSLYTQFWSTFASILITLVGVPLYYLWLWGSGVTSISLQPETSAFKTLRSVVRARP